MTTTRRTRICTDCKQRPQDMSVIGPELCEVCLEFADLEIMHMDHDNDAAHEWGQVTDETCPVCNPELDTRHNPIVKRTGHTNTVAKSHTSHAEHDHACTPRDRAACRKANRK